MSLRSIRMLDVKTMRYVIKKGLLLAILCACLPLVSCVSLAIVSSETDQWFDKGGQHLKNKEYDAAIGDFDKDISLSPNFDVAYYNRGLAYSAKGQYDRAIEDYNKAISLNPNFAEAYNNRGLAYSAKGQYDRAIGDFDKAISLSPNNADVMYYSFKNYGKACNDWKKSCKQCKKIQLGTETRCL